MIKKIFIFSTLLFILVNQATSIGGGGGGGTNSGAGGYGGNGASGCVIIMWDE